jgi:hypothetical protein
MVHEAAETTRTNCRRQIKYNEYRSSGARSNCCEQSNVFKTLTTSRYTTTTTVLDTHQDAHTYGVRGDPYTWIANREQS